MNHDEKDDLFDLFREKEQTFDEIPPDNTWQRLEQRLQQKKEIQRRPRLEVPMYLLVLIIILLLICGFLGVYITQKAVENPKIEQPKNNF